MLVELLLKLASFPGSHPASRLTVLQVTESWARAWERGYVKPHKAMLEWSVNAPASA